MDTLVQLSRQEQTVDVAGEVAFHRQVAGGEARRMAERHDRPIAKQDTCEPGPKALRGFEIEGEDELGEHTRETDAAEHATEAHVLEALPLEAVVIDDTEQHENQATLNDFAADFAASAFRQATRQRIRRRDTSHEKEERKDEIFEVKAVPSHMTQLRIYHRQPTPAGQRQEGDDDLVPADNPEEVESAQGIE